MKIGAKTIKNSIDCCRALMTKYQKELNEAFIKADDALSVSLKLKLSPSKRGGMDIKADISFVAEQIKDTTSSYVDENQCELFSEPKVISFKDRRGRVGNPPRFKPLGG